MPNVKISEKGKALLRRKFSSGRVVNAIVRGGSALSSQEGLLISVDGNGKTVRVRTAKAR